MWLFQKPDDKREPIVIIMGAKEEAQEKLKKIVYGHGLIGQWEILKLSLSDAKKLRKQFEVDTLYMLDPKEG